MSKNFRRIRKGGSIHIHLPYKEGSKRCTLFLPGAKRLLPFPYLIFSFLFTFSVLLFVFYFSSTLLLRTT